MENVTAEALPESFRVKLADPTQYDVVASAFAGRPGIEQVNDQRQILDKFFALLNGAAGGRADHRRRDARGDGAAHRQHDASRGVQPPSGKRAS